MSHYSLAEVGTYIRHQAAAYCESSNVPGYRAGLYHAGDQSVIARGVANVATCAPMRRDTGFLYGSVTKLLTTTLVLQHVERGVIDLDERVITYLPEFKLAAPSAAETIRIRHLLTHTNGIDADLFFPDAKGRGALKVFVDGLEQHCGMLFAPDDYISYSNGGMIVAGRVLEVVTGTSFHDLLERDVYAPVGMHDSCTSAEAAILRSRAIGHFPAPTTGSARRTDMFKLPDSWAPAGSTPIGTIGTICSHSAARISPKGQRQREGACCRLTGQHACSPWRMTWRPRTLHPSGLAGCACLSANQQSWLTPEHRPAEWQFWLSCLNTILRSPRSATIRGRWRCTIKSCCGSCANSSTSTLPTLCPRRLR
jgi:CubicO group peptidase (beta-lactamase class C family)